MTDSSTPDDANAPIDAEFETLEEAGDEGKASRSAAKTAKYKSWLILAGALALAAVLVLAVKLMVFNTDSPPGTDDSNTEITALSSRLDQLQNDLTALQSREDDARQTLLTRLEVLENKPAPAAVDDQVIADLQARLAVLESVAPSNAPDSDALTALAQRLNQLDAQILALKGDGGGAVVDEGRLKTLERRLTVLESTAGQASPIITDRLDALSQEIAALEARLLTLETRPTDSPKTSALALALLALDSAAQIGAPFEREWRTLSQLLPQNADVHMLASLARTGVPGRAALVRRFTTALPRIRAAAGQDPAAKPGVMGKMKGAFGSLISVRRVDDKATGVDAVLARVEAALHDQDLPGAMNALEKLDTGARQAAQGWLTQAQARLTLDQALARLKAMTAEANP
jgi:hypothetical protein